MFYNINTRSMSESDAAGKTKLLPMLSPMRNSSDDEPEVADGISELLVCHYFAPLVRNGLSTG
jgi:hypothetical protein